MFSAVGQPSAGRPWPRVPSAWPSAGAPTSLPPTRLEVLAPQARRQARAPAGGASPGCPGSRRAHPRRSPGRNVGRAHAVGRGSRSDTARAHGGAKTVQAWPWRGCFAKRGREVWPPGGCRRHQTAAAAPAPVCEAWPRCVPAVPSRWPAAAVAPGTRRAPGVASRSGRWTVPRRSAAARRGQAGRERLPGAAGPQAQGTAWRRRRGALGRRAAAPARAREPGGWAAAGGPTARPVAASEAAVAGAAPAWPASPRAPQTPVGAARHGARPPGCVRRSARLWRCRPGARAWRARARGQKASRRVPRGWPAHPRGRDRRPSRPRPAGRVPRPGATVLGQRAGAGGQAARHPGARGRETWGGQAERCRRTRDAVWWRSAGGLLRVGVMVIQTQQTTAVC
jgi:hypothetical protein